LGHRANIKPPCILQTVPGERWDSIGDYAVVEIGEYDEVEVTTEEDSEQAGISSSKENGTKSVVLPAPQATVVINDHMLME